MIWHTRRQPQKGLDLLEGRPGALRRGGGAERRVSSSRNVSFIGNSIELS